MRLRIVCALVGLALGFPEKLEQIEKPADASSALTGSEGSKSSIDSGEARPERPAGKMGPKKKGPGRRPGGTPGGGGKPVGPPRRPPGGGPKPVGGGGPKPIGGGNPPSQSRPNPPSQATPPTPPTETPPGQAIPGPPKPPPGGFGKKPHVSANFTAEQDYKGNDPRPGMARHKDFDKKTQNAMHKHFSNPDNIPDHIQKAANDQQAQIGKVTYTPLHQGGYDDGSRPPDEKVHSTARYWRQGMDKGMDREQIGGAVHVYAHDIEGVEHYHEDPSLLPPAAPGTPTRP